MIAMDIQGYVTTTIKKLYTVKIQGLAYEKLIELCVNVLKKCNTYTLFKFYICMVTLQLFRLFYSTKWYRLANYACFLYSAHHYVDFVYIGVLCTCVCCLYMCVCVVYIYTSQAWGQAREYLDLSVLSIF